MEQRDLWLSTCEHMRGWWVAHFGDTVRITCTQCGYAEEMREAVYLNRFKTKRQVEFEQERIRTRAWERE